MKTLEQKADEEEEGSSNSTVANGSLKKKTKLVSFPNEIIEDIVSRLPVKSILRSRSVSKPWLLLISGSPFTKLQFNRATESHRTGFFISAIDRSNKKCHYLTAGKEGGALTKLMTVDEKTGFDLYGPSCLNGLVYFTTSPLSSTPPRAFVINPSTRKIFQLPHINPTSDKYDISGYLYGFDESSNEHKILLVKFVYKTMAYEFMIYSLSSISWRKIDVQPPVGTRFGRFSVVMGCGVCVDSIVHVMDGSFNIVAFDFVAEKFSVISMPQGFYREDVGSDEDNQGSIKDIFPSLTKINCCLGVVLYDRERSEVRIWLLKDYDNRVWVKEIIQLPESWNDLVGRMHPTIDVNMDNEIVFGLSKVTENVISIPVYNRKTKLFRSVQFILDDQFASPDSVRFSHIRCYLESITPLIDNWSIKN